VTESRRQNGTGGILLGLLSYALFSVHDATIKWLVAKLPVPEVLFFRSIVIVIACLAIGRFRLIERLLATRMKGRLIVRSVMILIAWFLYFTAARFLPLALEMLTLCSGSVRLPLTRAGKATREGLARLLPRILAAEERAAAIPRYALAS
jgi:hypothetical protein